MDIRITSTKEQRPFLLALLVNAGFYYEDKRTVEDLECYSNWKYVLLENNRIPLRKLNFVSERWTGDDMKTYSWPQDATLIMDSLLEIAKTPKPIIVPRVTTDYDASVTTEGVLVGCQKVSWEKWDQLAQAVNKIRSK